MLKLTSKMMLFLTFAMARPAIDSFLGRGYNNSVIVCILLLEHVLFPASLVVVLYCF